MADNEQFSAFEEEQARLDETKQEITKQLLAMGGRYYGDDLGLQSCSMSAVRERCIA